MVVILLHNKLNTMNTVHYFKVQSTTDTQIQDQVQHSMSMILADEDENLVAVEDFGDYEVIYTFVSSHKADQMANILRSAGLLVDFKDVTENILMARENGLEFSETLENHTELLNKFILSNLTVDMVLDKINENGMSSLGDNDYKVLGK